MNAKYLIRNDLSDLVPQYPSNFILKKLAFTLAEVLITLAIIGVVAAMTMPSLIQHFQKKSLETQTQRFYSMMSQAVKQYMADYGVDDLRHTPLASDNYEGSYDDNSNYTPANGEIESIRDFVTKYLKVVKECDHDANDCFAPEYQMWNGSKPDGENSYNFTTEANIGSRRDYVLADGSVIRIGYGFNLPFELYVDVNGKKGPNRVGYDLWFMDIFWDGVVDESGATPECRGRGDAARCNYSSLQEAREDRFSGNISSCKDGSYGGCFGHFLNNNFKFDY